MLDVKIKGMEQLQRKLKRLEDSARKLDGQHQVPITELLTPAFVSQYTKYANAQELFDASGFKIDSQEDFKAISEAEWDIYIRSVSQFSCWHDMLSKASAGWAKKKIGL